MRPKAAHTSLRNTQRQASPRARVQPRIPQRFALKELISPKVFPLGQNENIRDYLPLNEAAIQRYMRHSSIVDTYWADVRCLHPDTNQPLNVGLNDLEGAWTPLDNLSDFEKTYTEAAERPAGRGGTQVPFKAVKLQMRIAMEHCDLGAPLCVRAPVGGARGDARGRAACSAAALCAGGIDPRIVWCFWGTRGAQDGGDAHAGHAASLSVRRVHRVRVTATAPCRSRPSVRRTAAPLAACAGCIRASQACIVRPLFVVSHVTQIWAFFKPIWRVKRSV